MAQTDGSPNGASIYWNGELKAGGTVWVPNNVVRNFQYIGRSNWWMFGDADFVGKMDEFAIYQTVLGRIIEVNGYFTDYLLRQPARKRGAA